MSVPEVTVLMSVHNGEEYVQEAIDSILGQTFRNLEFLIIDDASTDGTPEILRRVSDARVRVERVETNIGLTACLNRGLELARGELVARQDADDISHPARLGVQREFLQHHPDVVVLGAQAQMIDGAGRSLGVKRLPLTHQGIEWMAIFDNPLVHSVVMFRKAVVTDAGGYDEKYTASQDYELWTRLGEKHRLANLPDSLLTLRCLEGSVTRTHRRPELIRAVQSRQAKRQFPDRTLSERELELIGQFRTRVEPEAIRDFRELFSSLLAEYREREFPPEAARDLKRTVGLQRERVGYNLLTQSRSEGLKEIAAAIREWPGLVAELPWLRIAGLALLGDSARRLYEKFA